MLLAKSMGPRTYLDDFFIQKGLVFQPEIKKIRAFTIMQKFHLATHFLGGE